MPTNYHAQQIREILERVKEILNTKPTVLIAIDGTCGSGKTTISDAIRSTFPCNVYHTDDFYLPYPKRREGWRQIPCANMDLERLKEEVLIPASKNEPVFYRPYDCPKNRFVFEKYFPVAPVTIVEGNYSFHPLLEPYYDIKIFLTLPREEQKRRLKLREKEEYSDFISTWIPLAEQYFQDYKIPEKSSVTIDMRDM